MESEIYEIVEKSDVPKRMINGQPSKWRDIFDPLEDNKAVKFICESRKELRDKAQSISKTLKYSKPNYKIHYRSVPEGVKFALYVWKEIMW